MGRNFWRYAKKQSIKNIKFKCSLNALQDIEPEEFSELFIRFLKSTTLEKIDLSHNDFSKELTIESIKAAQSNKKVTLLCEGNGLSKLEIATLRHELSLQRDALEDIKINTLHSLRSTPSADRTLIFSLTNNIKGNKLPSPLNMRQPLNCKKQEVTSQLLALIKVIHDSVLPMLSNPVATAIDTVYSRQINRVIAS